MGFSEACIDQASDWMLRLYELFIGRDATMIEINPMSEDLLGRGKIILIYFCLSFLQNSKTPLDEAITVFLLLKDCAPVYVLKNYY